MNLYQEWLLLVTPKLSPMNVYACPLLEGKELQTSLISSPTNPTIAQVSGSVWWDFIRFEHVDKNASSPWKATVFDKLVKDVMIAIVECNN